MQVRRIKTLAVTLPAATGPNTVSAHAPGLYVGGSLGSPRCLGSLTGISGIGSGLSGKVFGGYQVAPNIGLEAGAADLGHIDNGNSKAQPAAPYRSPSTAFIPMHGQLQKGSTP